MESRIIDECKELSLAGKITFPEVVQKMAATGVERYIADLVACQMHYYGKSSSTYSSKLKYNADEVANDFDAAAVKQAIVDIQNQRINYVTFLDRVISAGCTHYEVFIRGRKAIYFGRDGSQHIELFPSK